MPIKSNKQQLLNHLEVFLIQDWMFLEIFEEDYEKQSKKLHEIIDSYLMNSTIVENSPYVSRETIPKSNYFSEVIPHLDERRFRVLVRMNYHNFDKILNIIQSDPVFCGKNSEKQFPIYKQLMIVLYRLGCSGEGATTMKIAFLFGIGDGSTIDKLTKRIFKAILRKKDEYLNWPSPEERSDIVERTMNELPQCIGYVDGSEVPLSDKPLYDSESFFSRKHRYSLKIQVVCDFNKKIRHVVSGYPGAVHDARIYKNCELATKQEIFFSGPQYIVGDSAYKLTSTVITPFKATSKQATPQLRNMFNYTLGKFRIRVENTFGLLYERFNSLKELRIRIGDDYSLMHANCWILVCCILHNCIENDDFDVENEFSDNDEDDNEEISREIGSQEGETKRMSILEFIRKNQ